MKLNVQFIKLILVYLEQHNSNITVTTTTAQINTVVKHVDLQPFKVNPQFLHNIWVPMNKDICGIWNDPSHLLY